MNNQYSIAIHVCNKMRANVGRFPAETGGLLGSKKENVIDCFCFDKWAKTTGSTFYYDVEKMSEVYRIWRNKGISLVGVIHSHPYGITSPSYHDISSALLHMNFLETKRFFMPIVQPSSDGLFTLYFYTVIKDENQKLLILNLNCILKAKKDGGYSRQQGYFKPKVYSIEELNMYLNGFNRDSSSEAVPITDSTKTERGRLVNEFV